jgi:hypothetical protein
MRIPRLFVSAVAMAAMLIASGFAAGASPAQAVTEVAAGPGACVPANPQSLHERDSGVQAVPAAAAPSSGWLTCPLGEHIFGHLRAPDAIVARADRSQVGFHAPPRDGLNYGPWSFDVAPDGSVWLVDEVNDRLLSWAPGQLDHPRYVPLPVEGPIDIAASAQGTIYVTATGGGRTTSTR